MPIYEYKCKDCGDKFEIMRGISASLDDVKCPKCGAEKPEKVISAFCGGSPSGANKGNLKFPT